MAVAGPCFVYIFYGMYDVIFESLCYWAMGALSNDPEVMMFVSVYLSPLPLNDTDLYIPARDLWLFIGPSKLLEVR